MGKPRLNFIKRSRFISLKVRMLLGLAILLALAGGLVAVSEALLEQIEAGRSAVSEEWLEINHVLRLSHAAQALRAEVYETAIERNTAEPGDIEAARQDVRDKLDALEKFQELQKMPVAQYDAEERRTLAAIMAAFDAVEARLEALETHPDLAVYYYRELYPLFDELEHEISRFIQSAEKEMNVSLSRIQQAQNRSEKVLFAWLAGLAALLAFFAAAFAMDFLRPIGKLHRGVQRMAQRNFSARIRLDRQDELGELAEAFNAMAEELEQYTSRMESELERSHRLAIIGRLAAGVAHEINNPLASIRACAEGILRRVDSQGGEGAHLDEADVEYLRQIRGEVSRCKNITEKLLDFSRKRPIRIEPVDLGAILNDTLQLVRHQIQRQPIELNFTPPNFPVIVMGDAGKLKQVALNLTINAIEAVRGEGRIEVEVRSENDQALLTVRDSGDGLTPEELDQLFEPFFTTKESEGGTGLGLALCYSIVTAHGGDISVQSEGRGRGAAFTVRLPSPPAVERASHPREERQHVAG